MRPTPADINVRLTLGNGTDTRSERHMSATVTASEHHPETGGASMRELDHRTSDGGEIHVSLLWNQHTGHLTITVDDRRLGHSFAFGVAATDAVGAFRHPYAYAPGQQVADAIHRAANKEIQ
jgi:hypothetical protein